MGLFPGLTASVWLGGPQDTPKLAYPRDPVAIAMPLVVGSIRRRKKLRDGSHLALPLIAPRSGPIGSLLVSLAPEMPPLDPAQEEILGDIAHEASLALETAWLYEQALAQRVRSEAILARVADAVVVTDAGGLLKQFNRSAIEILCFEPVQAARRPCGEVLGLHLDARTLDCSTGCALLKLSEAAKGGGIEVTRMLADGRKQPLLANASAVAGPDGVITEVVHSFRDITSLKEADEAKTMFLATASHELKTPLTVIRGFSEMLMADGLQAEVNGTAVEAIARRSVELNRIVDRILLSSRIEAGRVSVTVREVDIASAVTERAEAFARSTSRDVHPDVPDDLPLVRCDLEGFTSALDHLIDNAIKYSPEGGRVDVRLVARENTVDVEVSDHGIGMTSEQAARCFEKFFQGESSDVRRFGGTGIGLYIVRSLIEAMDGSVAVDSEPNRGSTFTMRLQRADTYVGPAAPPPEPSLPETPEPSQIREFMRQMGIPTAPGGRR